MYALPSRLWLPWLLSVIYSYQVIFDTFFTNLPNILKLSSCDQGPRLPKTIVYITLSCKKKCILIFLLRFFKISTLIASLKVQLGRNKIYETFLNYLISLTHVNGGNFIILLVVLRNRLYPFYFCGSGSVSWN